MVWLKLNPPVSLAWRSASGAQRRELRVICIHAILIVTFTPCSAAFVWASTAAALLTVGFVAATTSGIKASTAAPIKEATSSWRIAPVGRRYKIVSIMRCNLIYNLPIGTAVARIHGPVAKASKAHLLLLMLYGQGKSPAILSHMIAS